MKAILFWLAIIGFCWLVTPGIGIPIVLAGIVAAFLVSSGYYLGRNHRSR